MAHAFARARRRVLIGALAVGTALLGLPASSDAMPVEGFPDGAIIDNDVVRLGVNNTAELNFYDEEFGEMTGVRSLLTGNEATAPGCPCEGWGAGNATEGNVFSGWANQDEGGAFNLELVDFSADDSSATSVVNVLSGEIPMMEVVHDFHESSSEFLYEVTVTMRNTSDTTLTNPVYRRVMDWDVEPTPFDEFVTIDGVESSVLLYSSNGGFSTANPLGERQSEGFEGPGTESEGDFFYDAGPNDHGALFDFGFDPLAPGESRSFNIYYGTAPTENEALLAIDFVGATLWSLGQPNTENGPTLGEPNTFVFGFSAVGGGVVRRVSLRKAPDDPSIEAGDPNGWTIAVSNPSGDALELDQLDDVLPPGFHYVPDSAALDGAALADPTVAVVDGHEELRWTGPISLPAETVRHIHFSVTTSESIEPGEYFNNASGTASLGEDGVPVRSSGPAGRVTVVPPTIATEPEVETSTGAVFVDEATGETTISMARGAPSEIRLLTEVSCPDESTPTSIAASLAGESLTITETSPGSGIYEIVIPVEKLASGTVEVEVVCSDVTIANDIAKIVLYDPSGFVTDASTGAPIDGAKVTLYKVPFALPDSGGVTRDCRTVDTRGGSSWDHLPPASTTDGELANPLLTPAEIDPAVNPQYTDSVGHYGWDVAQGCWFVVVDAAGYQTLVSPIVGVPPEVTDLDLALTPVTAGGGGGGGGGGGSGGSAVTTTVPPASAPNIGELAGRDRIGTAIDISQSLFLGADKSHQPARAAQVAVLARADDFADGLVAAPLAATEVGPVLLTQRNELDDRVAAELGRILDAGATVFLVGGTAALDQGVETAVEQLGYTVQRVAGVDRFATSVAVAERVPSADRVWVATGRNFADALAAGAATGDDAVLVLTDDELVPAVVGAYLDGHSGEIVAVGGPAARALPDAEAVAGANRYATSVAVAELTGRDEVIGLATGATFADALSAAAHLAILEGSLLLTPTMSLDPDVALFLEDRAAGIEDLYIYGGTSAIAQSVRDAARNIVTR